MKKANIYIIDDDDSIREGLKWLLQSAGFHVKLFTNAEDFLRCKSYKSPACILLDIRMPGLNGIDLQEELLKRNITTPVIFITGHGDISISVHAMKKGAIDFLTKPFDDVNLFSAINNAIEKDIETCKLKKETLAIKRRLKTLTPREYEILPWIITGKLNKQIAYCLKIVEKTAIVHRCSVMKKMGVHSVAELVRLAQKAGISPAKKR